MNQNNNIKLKTMVEMVIDNRGKNPPYSENGYEIIETACISGKNKFPDYSLVRKYVDVETYNKWFRSGHPEKDDLLFITVGNGIGSVSIMKENRGSITQNLIGIRFNKYLANSNFYYYFFSQNDIYNFLQSMNIGSAQPSLKVPHLLSIDVPHPSIEIQTKIASILSSLDDKIDLLHRQNKTLEALAETLFRQWFVEEASDVIDEKPLSYFGKIICGKTPSKNRPSYFGGNIPFIKIPDMHNKTFVFKTTDSLTETGCNFQNRKTIPEKSICVSCIATVGLVSMNAFECQTNQQINSLVPNKNEYRYFLYLCLKSCKKILETMASGGTTTMNLNTGDFSEIKVVFISENKIYDFHQRVESFFDKIFFNQLQIILLENLRDTLLPKLMSGEIRVRE